MLCRVALGTQIVEQRIIIQREALQKLEISIQIIFKAKHLNVLIKYIHYTHNQRESKASFQSRK